MHACGKNDVDERVDVLIALIFAPCLCSAKSVR